MTTESSTLEFCATKIYKILSQIGKSELQQSSRTFEAKK